MVLERRMFLPTVDRACMHTVTQISLAICCILRNYPLEEETEVSSGKCPYMSLFLSKVYMYDYIQNQLPVTSNLTVLTQTF